MQHKQVLKIRIDKQQVSAGLQSYSSCELSATSVQAPGNEGASRVRPSDESNKSTLLLDMGEFRFLDFPELQLNGQAGSAALRGVNLMQILPEPLAQRAGLFPPLPSLHQVCTQTHCISALTHASNCKQPVLIHPGLSSSLFISWIFHSGPEGIFIHFPSRTSSS